MRQSLFGTDGVRGAVGDFLTAELALRLARAATLVSSKGSPHDVRIVVLRDPRESGEMLEAAICAGIAEAGGHAAIAGVLPTPAAALLINSYQFDLGIVVSASHNPYFDNGIKFFGRDGHKLSDEKQREIERLTLNPPEHLAGAGRVEHLHGAVQDYVRALHEHYSGLSLDGVNVAVDCANGATYVAAPQILGLLGANVTAINTAPDGRNINSNCGSTDMAELAALVRAEQLDVGFAFDGDGDRVLAVDGAGEPVDGDELIALIALAARAQERLTGDGVAVTVMSNFGLHRTLEDAGIQVATTTVGDRQILAELKRRGWRLGGEQSGHIIDMDYLPSGDGIAAMLLTLQALAGRKLRDHRLLMKLPQKLINIRTNRAVDLGEVPQLQNVIDHEERQLEGRGRILIRPSGTEPLVRIMVEAPSVEEADSVCRRLAGAVERQFGAS